MKSNSFHEVHKCPGPSARTLEARRAGRCSGLAVRARAAHCFVLCLCAFTAPGQAPDAADQMLNLATANQPLVHSAVVDAPVAEVWKAFTTKEGITGWMVPAGEIDLRVGGKMRTSYTKGSDLTGPDVIENTIISFDPQRMFSIKITKAPERFPFKKAMQHVWTVIYFEPVAQSKTRVTCRMLGFDDEEESVRMRLFFLEGNRQTLEELVKHFAKRTP
jgi:uncharacterized protein YndB with AHSA1/START domain